MNLRTMKEGAIRSVARQYINSKLIADYGVMTKLEIDRTNKTIHAELELKGEAQPISVDVNGYELIAVPGRLLLKLSHVKISREWVNAVFQRFARDKTLEVPDVVRALL